MVFCGDIRYLPTHVPTYLFIRAPRILLSGCFSIDSWNVQTSTKRRRAGTAWERESSTQPRVTCPIGSGSPYEGWRLSRSRVWNSWVSTWQVKFTHGQRDLRSVPPSGRVDQSFPLAPSRSSEPLHLFSFSLSPRFAVSHGGGLGRRVRGCFGTVWGLTVQSVMRQTTTVELRYASDGGPGSAVPRLSILFLRSRALAF